MAQVGSSKPRNNPSTKPMYRQDRPRLHPGRAQRQRATMGQVHLRRPKGIIGLLRISIMLKARSLDTPTRSESWQSYCCFVRWVEAGTSINVEVNWYALVMSEYSNNADRHCQEDGSLTVLDRVKQGGGELLLWEAS